MDRLVQVLKKVHFQSIYGCLSVYRHIVTPLLSQTLSFPTVFANIWAAFLQEHVSIYVAR